MRQTFLSTGFSDRVWLVRVVKLCRSSRWIDSSKGMRRESSPSIELSCGELCGAVWAGVLAQVDVVSVFRLRAEAVTVGSVKSQSTPYLTQLVHLGLPSSHYTQKSVRRIKNLSMIGQTTNQRLQSRRGLLTLIFRRLQIPHPFRLLMCRLRTRGESRMVEDDGESMILQSPNERGCQSAIGNQEFGCCYQDRSSGYQNKTRIMLGTCRVAVRARIAPFGIAR